jgi:hypothetical protein
VHKLVRNGDVTGFFQRAVLNHGTINLYLCSKTINSFESINFLKQNSDDVNSSMYGVFLMDARTLLEHVFFVNGYKCYYSELFFKTFALIYLNSFKCHTLIN